MGGQLGMTDTGNWHISTGSDARDHLVHWLSVYF